MSASQAQSKISVPGKQILSLSKKLVGNPLQKKGSGKDVGAQVSEEGKIGQISLGPVKSKLTRDFLLQKGDSNQLEQITQLVLRGYELNNFDDSGDFRVS